MKSNSTTIIAALLIAAGIFCLGLFIRSGINNMAFSDRQVTVKGLAEREVEANNVTWPIAYSVAGNDLIALYDQMTSYNEKIITFLTSNGIGREDITIGSPDTYNATTNRYSSDNFRYNYSLSCTVTVNTSKVKEVQALISRQAELLKEGVPFSNNYINYQYTALNDIKPAMIAEATQNAREAAAQFAQDSGSQVGKMKTANQGQFSIEDTSNPSVKKVRVVSTIVYYLED
ncbi:MAG: SIMPL domain-containing protein [Bacteroidales bacterium]|nr:SIMPL domain-containing protein [Bacteroidales bacterium]